MVEPWNSVRINLGLGLRGPDLRVGLSPSQSQSLPLGLWTLDLGLGFEPWDLDLGLTISESKKNSMLNIYK